jgi:hypothetical protein
MLRKNGGSRSRAKKTAAASSFQQAPVENNKKRIMRLVQDPIRAWYNCQVPMRRIDMVGVVKNGKTLCVECGCMTEYRNYNMTHYGPVCMQHLSCTMQHHHPTYRQEQHQLRQQTPQQQRKARHPYAQPEHGAERRLCRLCSLLPPTVKLAMRDECDNQLSWIEACHNCHHNLRPLLARHSAMLPKLALRRFAETRRYKHTLC